MIPKSGNHLIKHKAYMPQENSKVERKSFEKTVCNQADFSNDVGQGRGSDRFHLTVSLNEHDLFICLPLSRLSYCVLRQHEKQQDCCL